LGEVGVLVKIDEKGNVIDAKAIVGHPLLRAACVVAIKQWQFKTQKRNKLMVRVVGVINFEFNPDYYNKIGNRLKTAGY
jgi:TonB family protein